MAARKGSGPQRGGGRAKPVSGGKGKPAKPRTPSGGGKPMKGRNPIASARGPKAADSRGAGRTGAIKPGRPAGRGSGREKPREDADDLGGTQIEGRQAVRELLIAGRRKVHEIWVASDLDESEVVDDIREIARANRVMVVEVSRRKLEYTARSEAPQGVIAMAAPIPAVSFDSFLKRRPGRAPFYVAVDGVTDPGNLGALLRCCDGAGVDGVILPRHRSVHVTPTVAKAAVGAVEHVPMALVGGLPTALARLKEAGIWIVGLDDAADKNLFDLGDLAKEGICLVLGAEGPGLSRLVRERCDIIVSIPMRGRLSSLNVSAAAALATYEVARHR